MTSSQVTKPLHGRTTPTVLRVYRPPFPHSNALEGNLFSRFIHLEVVLTKRGSRDRRQ